MKQEPKKWKSDPIDRRAFLKKTGGIFGVALLSQLPLGSLAFAEDQDFSFAIIADTHIDPYIPVRSERLRTIFNEISISSSPKAEFILHVGDVVEAGLAEEYQEYNKIVPAALNNRIFAVPGNHEVRWDEWAGELYNDLFGESQYSFDHGGIHFIALDPTQLLQEPGFFTPSQLKWLEKDLQKAGLHMPVVVYLHYPIGNDNYYISNENKFFEVIERYNVRAVFTGHIHREEVWKQNGMTLIALPAAKDRAVYHWVEKKTASNGSPLLAVYHAEFTNSANSEKTLLVEIPLEGVKTAQYEKPKLVHFSEPKDGSGTGFLHVELSPKTSILSVQYQFWPEYPYAGKNAGEWKDLFPAASSSLNWKANVDTSKMASGIYLLQVRVTNTKGEFWDEFREVSNTKSEGVLSKSRVNWEQELSSPIQADLITVKRKNRSSSLVVASTMDGQIVALDPEHAGKIKWNYKTGGAVIGTPAVNEKQNLVLAGSADHTLYALDTESGSKIWTCKLPKPILGTPLYIESANGGSGTVLVPAGRMMAGVNAETGTLLWSTSIGGFSAAKPASDGRLAIIGSGDGKVQAMDVATGNVIWSKTIASKEAPYRTLLYSPWASKAELLLVGADGRKLVLIGDVTNAYALDCTTGAEVWRLKGGFLYSSPLILSGPNPILILTDEWGKVFAVDPATGVVHWKTTIEQRIFNASPVLAENTVYVTGVNGLVTGLNPKDGSIVDRYRFSTAYTYSTPVESGNFLVAGGQDGKVRSIKLQDY
ncbi:PQQ-binding-like beta-propeller repeat protein [Bacillus sp. sid0103]|uniref:outer membrane protein assembly factor BamB family protein n=1 Tax=Bacillus sp. sid0103 TaxID=2856337 RepID=UPI001C45757B|nr:PQQ-binding-like beta-propeller repeat protein [Bacillus sp. sid0103]MBV7504395.1 PQQ-binding-like beta-propeller repeat protein [Bacillus sp. sid0103]